MGKEYNNGWTKIEDDNWLKSIPLSGSITKYYVHAPDEDYLGIVVLVLFEDGEEQLFLNDYLWLKEDQDINDPTHYRVVEKFKLPNE